MKVGRVATRVALVAAGAAVLATTVGIPSAQAATTAAPARVVVAAPAAAQPVSAAVAAPIVAAAPAAQSALTQSAACSGAVGAPVTCSLTAQVGSLTAGGVTVPVWNFVGAGVANPTIVATVGQPVTITLTNGLTAANVPVSLAFPGMTGVTSDYTGILPADAPKPYTFTPNAPGTYVYQAGHILRATGGDVGPREVAMGLAGAIVVRPADFVANTVTGTATSTDLGGTAQTPPNQFDDEAVLLLSEVDPAFAAAPTTYDLRQFKGTIRLINGKAYPTTTPIASDAGRKVLLRYVNAGVVSHAMGVLGLRQSIVAVNGHASDGLGLLADTVNAGETEDAIVSVPADGGSGNFAVYDSSGRLDTNGVVATGSTHRQLAFGGMLTFITANAVGLTSDTVGPNASAVTVTPTSITNTTTALSVSATFTDPTITINGVSTNGSNIVAARAWIDGNSAAPFAMALSGTTNPANGTVSIPAATVSALTSGTHTVFVQGQDTALNWGPTGSATFTVNVAGPAVKQLSLTPSTTNGVVPVGSTAAGVELRATGDDTVAGGTITLLQYAIDAGPRVNFDTATTTYGTAVVGGVTSIPWATVNALAAGTHNVSVWATDSGGTTSAAPAVVVLTVDKTGPSVDLNSGSVSPTPTNGTIGSPVDPTSLKVAASFTDAAGIAGAEGFLQPAVFPAGQPTQGTPDTTKSCIAPTAAFPCANGTGFVFVAGDGAFGGATEAGYGTIPLTQITNLASGTTFTVWVHAKDAAGNWGPFTALPLAVDKTAPTAASITVANLAQLAPTPSAAGPVTLTVTAADAGATASGITQVEWFEGADPGVGLATQIPVTAAQVTTGTNPLTVTATLPLTARQFHTVNVRVRDGAGNWSAAKATNRYYVDPIFADSFQTGNAGAWTGAGVSGSPTFPTVTLNTVSGNRAMLTANGNANSNVTTPVLTGNATTGANPPATVYKARFLFRNNGLNGANVLRTGNNAANTVTLLSLRFGTNATTGRMAEVQYAYPTTNGAVPQVRLAVRNSAGTLVPSAWVNLPTTTTTHTLQLAWSAGTNQVESLIVDGTTTSLTVSTATTATVDRAILGTSSGTGVTGQAYFDYFEARRNSQP